MESYDTFVKYFNIECKAKSSVTFRRKNRMNWWSGCSVRVIDITPKFQRLTQWYSFSSLRKDGLQGYIYVASTTGSSVWGTSIVVGAAVAEVVRWRPMMIVRRARLRTAEAPSRGRRRLRHVVPMWWRCCLRRRNRNFPGTGDLRLNLFHEELGFLICWLDHSISFEFFMVSTSLSPNKKVFILPHALFYRLLSNKGITSFRRFIVSSLYNRIKCMTLLTVL